MEQSRPRISISRRHFIRGGSVVLGGLAVVGCRRTGTATGSTVTADDGSADASLSGAAETSVGGSADAGQAAVERLADPRAGYDVRLDLIEHLHLADIDHHGTFIDFGGPSRFKYTLGGWRSGWGEQATEDGVSFTWAGASPTRLYFHLDEATPLRLRFRARPRTNRRLSFYVNDHPIDRINLGEGWTEQTIDVEQSSTRAGENSLKLAHSSNSNNGRGFALEWLRIIPVVDSSEAHEHESVSLPRAEALVSAAEIGGEERPVVQLRAPSRLSYYLDLPAAASLGMSLGLIEGSAATAKVRLTPANASEAIDLHEVALDQADSWSNAIIDFGEAAGKVVRLDLEVTAEASTAAEGTPVVGFATPSVMARPTPIATASAEPPRHVVVLLIDTLRADKLSLYGRTRVQSPQMERFAEQSTLFERCQAPANWTKPSCASLLTGLHPPSHRALTESGSLPGRIRMISEIYQEAGFSTAGLIANGYLARDFGFGRGWDHYRNYIREERRTEAEHVFSDAVRWMERHRDERMFLYIQTIDPHVPYDPPDDDLRLYDPAPYSGPIRNRSTGLILDRFKREGYEFSARDRQRLEALYDGEVTYHDRHFGQFIDRLDELNLLDETCLVVTADHGEEFFEHESAGHGHSLYQELLHVPLLVRCPELAPAGHRLGQVCSLVDIAPTILEASGLDIPEPMEGRSLVPDLRGAPPPMTSAGFSSRWDTGNNWELGWAARVGDWKLRMRGPAISYLYDLENDATEQRDVDSRYPVALRAARIALGQFLGAPSFRHWATAGQPSTRPRRRRPQQQDEGSEAQMTPELCQQLRALGYMDACD